MEEYELRDQTKGCPDLDNLLEIYRTLKHSLSKAKNEKRNILLALKKHYLHSLIYSELQYILLHLRDDTDSQFNKFIEDVLKNGIQNNEEISETSKLNGSNDIKININLSSQKGITLLRLHKIFKFPKFVDYKLTADSICYTPNLLEFSIKCITERNKRFSIQARPLIIDNKIL